MGSRAELQGAVGRTLPRGARVQPRAHCLPCWAAATTLGRIWSWTPCPLMGSLISAAWGWKGMTCRWSPPPSQVRDSPLRTPRKGQWITKTKVKTLLLHQFHCCYCYQDDLLQPRANEPCLSPWKKKEAKRSQPILRKNERKATGSSAQAFAGEKRCDGCMNVASKEKCGLTGFAPHTSSRGTSPTMQMCKSAQWKQKLSSDSKTFQLWSYYLATGHEETGAVSKEKFCYLY